MHTVYLISVWLHIVAAAVWIGGMVFLSVVLVPATRQPEYRGVGGSLIRWTGRRFRSVAWLCVGLLVLTGVFNLFYRGFGWAELTSRQLWQSPFGQVVQIKLVSVALILLLSLVHDFVIGPRATDLLQNNPGSPQALKFRRQASWIGRFNLLLALAAAALGVMLARGFPWQLN